MSHHSLNLNLNLTLPASQRSLYRLIWFQIQVSCVTFYPTFSRLRQRGAGSFMCAAELVWWTLGCPWEFFSSPCPCPLQAMLQHGAWKRALPWVAGGPGVDLHWHNWWRAINNIAGYWKHHLLCWSLLGSLLFAFPQRLATFASPLQDKNNVVKGCYPIALDTFHIAWDYYPIALPHLPLKGGKGDAFLLDPAGNHSLEAQLHCKLLVCLVVSYPALQDW